MRSMILYLVLLVLLPATGQAGKTFKERMEGCKSLEQLAQTVMESRQNGMELSRVLEVVNKGESNKLVNAIVMDAWDRPRFSTDRNKQRAVADFKDAIFRACLGD